MDKINDTLSLSDLLCFGTYTLHRAFSRFHQNAFSETGLTYPKFVILMALSEAGPMTVSELSARAGVEPQSLSPLLKKMETFGSLTRTRAPEDERRVLIELTDMGHALFQRAHNVVIQGFAEIDLDVEKTKLALAFLSEIRAKVEAAVPPKLNIDDILSEH